MSLRHGLLGLLSYGKMTGYELDKAFKASLNFFWQAQTSQIYRELNAMEKSGWLTSETVIQTDKPNKKLYSITEEGKKELKQWLLESSHGKDFLIRNSFLMKLFFSSSADKMATVTLLEEYRNLTLKALKELEETKDSFEYYSSLVDDENAPLYWSLTSDFGREFMKMCADWAENSIKKLEE